MKTFIPRAPALVVALALSASFTSLVVLADDRPATPKEQPAPDAPQAQQERLISLVLLLREPRKLDHHAIAHAASAAAGADFPEESVEDKAPYHRVRLKSGSYVISDLAEPYFEKPAAVAADVKGEHLREAILEHRGWIAVDWLGKGEPEDVRATYQQIGKMLASLAGRDVLAIYSPELDSFADFDGDAKATLLGRDPLALFPVPASAPSKAAAAGADAPAGAPEGVAIADDDPALKTARAEARRRWPEFVSSFNARKPGQYFGVKGPFEEGDLREFMWLTVDEIDGEQVHGRLESQPASLKGWKREQDIHIKVANVDDWLYVTPAKEAVGGFSEKVLSESAAKSRVSDERPAPRKEAP